MSSELIIHHNDLNELVFPNFREQEYNIFSNIITRVRDKGNEVLEFSANEVSKWFGNTYPSETLSWMLNTMAENMRQKGFVHISEVGDIARKAHITMFPTFFIDSDKKNNKLKSLTVRVNPDFLYLFNNLIKNFTQYELEEFISLTGKYTKRLYMLLKQFRNKGKVLTYQNRWDDFCKLLNIPEKYELRDIDKFILKPAIKELSKERSLFDSVRIPFENLSYTKIKNKGRGRGGKVVGIIFEFKPENIDPKDEQIALLEKENKALKEENDFANQKYTELAHKLGLNNEFAKFIYQSFRNDKGESIKIMDIVRVSNKLRVRFKNQENEKDFYGSFESEKHLSNYTKIQ